MKDIDRTIYFSIEQRYVEMKERFDNKPIIYFLCWIMISVFSVGIVYLYMDGHGTGYNYIINFDISKIKIFDVFDICQIVISALIIIMSLLDTLLLIIFLINKKWKKGIIFFSIWITYFLHHTFLSIELIYLLFLTKSKEIGYIEYFFILLIINFCVYIWKIQEVKKEIKLGKYKEDDVDFANDEKLMKKLSFSYFIFYIILAIAIIVVGALVIFLEININVGNLINTIYAMTFMGLIFYISAFCSKFMYIGIVNSKYQIYISKKEKDKRKTNRYYR